MIEGRRNWMEELQRIGGIYTWVIDARFEVSPADTKESFAFGTG
jgi:hypothetical protein